MMQSSDAIICPPGKPGGKPTVIDMAKITMAGYRESEVAIVTRVKAPELLAVFNEAWRDLHDVVAKLEAEKNAAEREVEDRAACVTLEVAPDKLRSLGLPCNAKTLDAVVNLDEEYKRLCDVYDEIKAVQEFLKGRMKSFENSYNSVKKIMGDDPRNGLQKRDQHLTGGDGDGAGMVGYQVTDKWCGVPGCGERQMLCSSGHFCKNGHGGAPSLDQKPQRPLLEGFGKSTY